MNRTTFPIVAVAVVLALAGCTSGEESSSSTKSTTTSARAISKSHAEAIWRTKFVPLVEAHGVGEKAFHLNTPGVEQECKLEEGAYHCKGIVPSEENFIPGHEADCIVVQVVIDAQTGHIKEEAADPISQYREAFHTEVECHL